MPTSLPTRETARTVDEQFLDLIYGDQDLLAAEFDAIIAVGWPEPPVDRSGPSEAGRHPLSGPAHRTAGPLGPVSRPRRPSTDGGVGQRSPPFRHVTLGLSRKEGDRHT